MAILTSLLTAAPHNNSYAARQPCMQCCHGVDGHKLQLVMSYALLHEPCVVRAILCDIHHAHMCSKLQMGFQGQRCKWTS